jgi:DNA topoisomerase-1
VWICESPRGHLQVSGIDSKGRRQYIYHTAYREKRDFNKFNHVIAFGSALPRIRRAVSRDLARPGLPKRKVLALAVRLLDRTCMRIGSNEYAQKNGSYGLTTLKNEHVRIRGSEVHFHFRAKSGVEQSICLEDAELARMLDETRKLRGQDLFQYRDEAGNTRAIQSTDVNDYLRQIAGEKVTAKEFRTWHGTVQMLLELTQTGPAAGTTEAKRRLAAAVKSTANKLGNRPATCRGYYVHPEVIDNYLSHSLFKGIEKSSTPQTLRECESVLLDLVRRVQRPRVQKKKGRSFQCSPLRTAA